MRLSILAPEDGRFEGFHAISPDGSRLAFTLRDPSGKTALWLRPLQSSTAVRIPGTDGAGDPFWSPDGGFIGFFAKGKLRVMSADAGVTSPSIQTLADVQDPRGGTWNRDGVIVFARNLEDGLYSVPSSGGPVKQLTTLDRGNRENSHRWPQFLPDGRHVLFMVRSATTDQQGIYVIELGSPDKKQLLLPSPASALVATFEDKAALLFMREQTLVAQPIDLRSLSLQGTPTPLAESLGILTNRGLFSVSDAGAITYRSTFGADENSAWFDATGKQLEPGPPGAFQIRVAPDGKHLAFGRADVQQGAGDIWLQDLERGGLTRFTTHRAYDWLPIWSPKGDRIVFASNRDGVMDLYEKPVSGSEVEHPILKSAHRKTPTDWSLDGEFVFFNQEDARGARDVWALPMTGDKTPFAILQSDFDEANAVLSPDGKWLAYASDEAGDYQVYVQPFAGRPGSKADLGEGRKTIVSTAGGYHPCWTADGRQLLYLGLDKKLLAVNVVTNPTFTLGATTVLFQTSLRGSVATARVYDVTPDGKRFIMSIVPDDRAQASITLMLNWPSSLNR